MPDNLENRIVPVLGKNDFFGAFLRHVAEIPIKLVKRGNGNRCCFGYVPETPINLVQTGWTGQRQDLTPTYENQSRASDNLAEGPQSEEK